MKEKHRTMWMAEQTSPETKRTRPLEVRKKMRFSVGKRRNKEGQYSQFHTEVCPKEV